MIAAFINILTTNAAITALVPAARIYPVKLPQAVTMPAICVKRNSFQGNETKDAASAYDFHTLSVIIYGQSIDELDEISRTVRDEIQRFTGQVLGVNFENIIYQDHTDDDIQDLNGDLFILADIYEVHTQNAPHGPNYGASALGDLIAANDWDAIETELSPEQLEDAEASLCAVVSDTALTINSAQFATIPAGTTPYNVPVIWAQTGAAVGSKVGSDWQIPSLCSLILPNTLNDPLITCINGMDSVKRYTILAGVMNAVDLNVNQLMQNITEEVLIPQYMRFAMLYGGVPGMPEALELNGQTDALLALLLTETVIMRPQPNQATSYSTYDSGWRCAQGIYAHVSHSYVARIQQLDLASAAGDKGYVLAYDTVFGNKYRFTTADGTHARGQDNWYTLAGSSTTTPGNVIIYDHLTGLQWTNQKQSATDNITWFTAVARYTDTILGETGWWLPAEAEIDSVDNENSSTRFLALTQAKTTRLWMSDSSISNTSNSRTTNGETMLALGKSSTSGTNAIYCKHFNPEDLI